MPKETKQHADTLNPDTNKLDGIEKNTTKLNKYHPLLNDGIALLLESFQVIDNWMREKNNVKGKPTKKLN